MGGFDNVCVSIVLFNNDVVCSLLILPDNPSCNDSYFKISLRVINSGINPIAYAFFKRDINENLKRFSAEGVS